MENFIFDIALGKHRRETKWRNKKISWLEFLDMIRTTHRTHESYAEYIKAKPDRQAVIKDVGGFVGGYVVNGRRKKANILHRQIITLDLDFANTDFWFDFMLNYTCAAALYTTHKHSSSSPRYRLIIPLDREVDREEYEAIARRVAGNLGVELFDPSTFQPERLMYLPSTSQDGEFVFANQTGQPLCADEILNSYVDWRDVSSWPVSEKVSDLVRKNLSKQGDPTEKVGLIGAFCRTYNIYEAIATFLPDIYEPAGDGRYTYLKGTTAAGVVIYDELFSFSHHGSDPAGDKLCNAFDLVRLHLFGDLDADTHDNTPVSKRPSFAAMQDFVSKDKETRKVIGSERLNAAKIDFAEYSVDDEDAEPVNLDWLEDMDADKKGNYTATANNLALIFANDPALKNTYRFDEFEVRDTVIRSTPWRKIKGVEYLKDSDDAGIRVHIENAYGITGKDKINDAFTLSVQNNRIHPVREFIKAQAWDGVPRIDELLIKFMGAEDSTYVRNVTRKSLVAAVSRVFNPGCKFDYILTLVGPEGKLKSTLFRKLGGAWFSDSFAGVHGKEAVEQLQGKWILEIGELAGIRKSDVEAVKHFVAKQVDRFRPAYGRRTEDYPRQCIFVATTNENEFLQGVNGNRRFWPVVIWSQAPELDVIEDLTDAYIRQIWAEAYALYRKGERTYLLPHEEDEARNMQELHTESDDRADIIVKYLDIPLPAGWDNMLPAERRAYLSSPEEIAETGIIRRERVTVPEIWVECLGGAAKDLTVANSKLIRGIMKKIQGWEVLNVATRSGRWYGVNRGYVRKT